MFINGHGDTSSDFCFIENTVQTNLLAAVANDSAKDHMLTSQLVIEQL